MPAIIECRDVSKAFVLRTNRQYLPKDPVLAMVRRQLRESRRFLSEAPMCPGTSWRSRGDGG